MNKETEATTVKLTPSIKAKRTSETAEEKHARIGRLYNRPKPSNLWNGFAVEPAHGTWEQMKYFILSIICGNNREMFLYVMGWMAAMVQKPNSAGQIALFLNGAGGTGKSFFIQCLSNLMAERASHVTDLKQVTGKFNGNLKDCVLLVVEGAFSAGNNRVESVLKSLISEASIAIVEKRKDVQFIPSKFHVVMTGNDDRALGLDVLRRLCVLNVSDARQHDHEYFSDIAQELANGGLSAMLFDLQQYDLDGFDVRHVPQAQG